MQSAKTQHPMFGQCAGCDLKRKLTAYAPSNYNQSLFICHECHNSLQRFDPRTISIQDSIAQRLSPDAYQLPAFR